MQENKKKPAVRFAGFDDDWEQRKLGDMVEEITRTDPDSTAPIMMITANNGFIEQSERYAYNNAGERLKKYILLEKGELAYNHGASKLRPYGSCFALTTTDQARIPFVYHCFSVGQNNPEFMSIELNGRETEAQLRKIVSSGARMDGLLNISFEEYATISVLLPDIAEQMKIAEYFRQLDHLIALHQRKWFY
ncbi:MAG: restriction endonuclease subunit S [Clostridiales bacterium]|nr:restriction endonuclease subunit S [Clostridiales bacterium]